MVKGLQAGWGACSRALHLDHVPEAFTHWKDLIAVGLESYDIVILSTITGSCTSTLSGHTNYPRALAFSADGVFLISGCDDKTVKLWDIQTGRVAKTFHGHTTIINCVTISLDCTIIASGSMDKTIRLWGARTGECCCVIDKHNGYINSVIFSPMNSQLLISASDDCTIRQWGIDGHQIGPEYKGEYVTFSSDGAYFLSWGEAATMVRSSSSGIVTTKFQGCGIHGYCCFSPNDKFVAIGSGYTIYIWDITGSDPHLVKTFFGHTGSIRSVAFSSSLIISSGVGPIEFWQIGNLLTNPVPTNSAPAPSPSAPIRFVHLNANNGIAISSDLAGVVSIWEIQTGLCKASFHTPSDNLRHCLRDIRLIDTRLILVWYTLQEICVWDVEKRELLQTVDAPSKHRAFPPRISADGSKVFLLGDESIRAWSIWTGEVVGMVGLESKLYHSPPIIDGSRVWVHFEDLQTQGWDFGIPGSTPVPLSKTSLDKTHLDSINNTRWDTSPGIEDMVNGNLVFRLSGRYGFPTMVQWDNQYLVAGYETGEVLILDLNIQSLGRDP